MSAFPGMPVIYVPAYPALGRTVRGGRLYVDGVAVDETSFASDPLNPVRESHIPTLLAADVTALSVGPEAIRGASGPSVHVVDAETDEEVGRAAEVFCASGLRLAAGPAAFAWQLARRFGGPRAKRRLPRVLRTCLVVNGSLNERSAQQVDAARGWLPSCRSGDRGAGAGPFALGAAEHRRAGKLRARARPGRRQNGAPGARKHRG